MWNTPTIKQLAKLPKLYSTDGIKLPEKKVHMHFFMGGNDWYIMEYDGQDTFFGYTALNGDQRFGELGYISLSELKKLKHGFIEVDREIHWKPKLFKEIQQ